ncbi:MAG: VCBS repeat-containing protein [Gemmatimonadota bacterium]|nr:VCBS repeat-containing protein [Gemmatimonadota bacterium]
MVPAPALLDKTSWQRFVLPRMARRLGLKGIGAAADEEPFETGSGGALVRISGVYPDSARITRSEWDRIAAYYLGNAPASQPRAATPPVTVGLPGFRVRVPDFHVPSPMITLLHFDSVDRRLFVGDATPGHSTLNTLDGTGHLTRTIGIPSPLAQLAVHGDTLRTVFMGQLAPSDAPRGEVALIPSWLPGRNATIAWEVHDLQRPVFASWADLNGDGLEDVVVSEFGNLTGQLAWYEHLGNGSSRKHLLTSQPGAITTLVRDFDGDGKLDILALTAQGDEGISLFHGGAGGQFTMQRLLRFPPSYGSTSMQVVDMNDDGHPDIVYTNGDAGDYPGPPKPYHGVRIFLNDGHDHYAEQYFFPMPGAYKAIARDFDGDGDIDIAAISFFPDYASGAPLSFVYLENVGNLRFKAWTFPQADRGRWLTMEAGDLNGDGAVDLILGSFSQLDTRGDMSAKARWHQKDAPTLIILENTSRKGAPKGKK